MADSQSGSNIFSVRIVSIDHYMAPPIPGVDVCYSSFQGGKVNEVPVIRIYGSTPAGQKTCLHIHRVLPYLYVPCAGILPEDSYSRQGADACRDALALSLEKAMKLKGNAALKRQHVHGCSLVQARRFYGYHSSEELFVKIYLYHPHDVSRAANLLLEGAVLDKCLQPHESHIPFVLQFLIDYNLYGMGHLHLSKMKFRGPVPDVFFPTKFNCRAQHRQEIGDLTCESAGFQADSGRDKCLSSPVWISSTIPGDWIWSFPHEFELSSDQDMCHLKRQSVCELEGDATVDDILNQHFKIYTSLSQTNSDVKMVQSLIPIWEEEYERTGNRDKFLCPDPDKPLPEDVLKALSLGLGFENKLMEVCGEVKDALCNNNIVFSQPMIPSTNDENLIKSACINTDDSRRQPLLCLKEQNIVGLGSHCSLSCENQMHAADTCPKLLSVAEVKSSATIVPSDQKARDIEALGILRWLATSQAAEDINSDDELVRETILNPLLPATTFEKVLEKASVDYESESQKECQDILDSIDNFVDFEGLEERASHFDCHDPTLSARKIPQIDGSSDDLFLGPGGSVENSSKKDEKSECKMSSQNLVQQETSTSFSRKRKRNKSLWGSLPFSMTKQVSDDVDTVSFNCVDDTKESGTSSSTENALGDFSDSKIGNIRTSGCVTNEATVLVECSVRDLMRRRRSYRVEPAESESLMVEKLHSKGGSKEDNLLCPKRLDFCGLHKDENDKGTPKSLNYGQLVTNTDKTCCEPVASEHFCSSSMYDTVPLLCHNDNFMSTSTDTSPLQMAENFPLTLNPKKQDSALWETCKVSNFVAGHFKTSADLINSDVCSSKFDLDIQSNETGSRPTDVRLQQTGTSGSGCMSALPFRSEMVEMNSYTQKCKHENRTSISGDKVVGKDSTAETAVLQNEGCSFRKYGGGNVSSMPTSLAVDSQEKSAGLIGMTLCKKPPTADWSDIAHSNASDSSSIHYTSVDERIILGTSGDYQGEKGIQKTCQGSNSNFHQEATLGVPTYYQNDGSFLYLLTPVSSPPSADSVQRWLLYDEGSLVDTNALLAQPPLKGSSESINALETLPPNGSNMVVADSGIKSHMTSIKEEANHEKDVILDAKLKPHCNDLATALKNEGNNVKLKACIDGSQDISQISGPSGKLRSTPLSQIGFRDPASVGAGQQLTLLSIEVQTESRGDLRPDPRFDAINMIALALQNDDDSVIEVYVLLCIKNGSCQRNLDGMYGCKMYVFFEEKLLFGHFVKLLSSFDPDILMGWDVQGSSLGFLAERAAHLGIGLLNIISRTPDTKIAAGQLEVSQKGLLDNVLCDPLIADSVALEDAIIEDEWGRTHASGVHVGGRIVLNVWRLMRNEVKLNMYSVEAVAEAVLRRKVPSIPHKVLTNWHSSGPAQARYRCIEYVIERAKLNLEIMSQLDMINRTSELARVFGIDFFSVLSRGSQYRVESMFLRLAHTQNYLAISPGNQQVASQPAMECLPLVMEPESGFYADPVVVLDFQSLYPSIIIAYNLCFCTCLGKMTPSKANTLGVSSYTPDLNVLQDLKDQVLLTPNGVMYVPSKVRKGVLPRLLEEILSTRIMVKQAVKKLSPSQQVLQRIFNARQLALKLIANVTYGYTAAGFSGRMPCAELADSIVQCGRSTLERAISYVNGNDKWKAEVIYGDTDSMFVLLKGRTVKESFQVGNEIASAITAMNPNPVTLKLEKVYHPCFLLTKKRYVGYSYESPDQAKPVFDAKGVETVRRDTCGAVAKIMEQSLRLFFEHQDIFKVKAYLQRQWTKILSGRVSLQDFVFAKEVRLGTYSSREGASLPPAAIVANKAMRADPRAEPRYAERVPYVVIHGEPGARLVDMVVDPLELLAIDSPYRLNDCYYIKKQIIPALQRVFGLLGANLKQWFLEIPRPVREAFGKSNVHAPNSHRTRIDYYYLSKHCILCGELVQASAHLCAKCSQRKIAAATAITGRTSKLEKEMQHLAAICRHCGGGDWLVDSGVKCTSLACSVFYERRKVQKELQGLSTVAAAKDLYPKCMVEWF